MHPRRIQKQNMICGKGKPVCPMPAAASENPARALPLSD